MRIVAIVTLALALGACNTASSVATNGGLTADANISTVTAQIVATAKRVCGYEPVASDLAGIVNDFVPGVDSVDAVATAICGAINGIAAASVQQGFTALARTDHVYVTFHGKKHRVRVK